MVAIRDTDPETVYNESHFDVFYYNVVYIQYVCISSPNLSSMQEKKHNVWFIIKIHFFLTQVILFLLLQ